MKISSKRLLVWLPLLFFVLVTAAILLALYWPSPPQSRTEAGVMTLLESVTDDYEEDASIAKILREVTDEVLSFLRININFSSSYSGGRFIYVSEYQVAKKIRDNYGDEAIPFLLKAIKSHRRAKVRLTALRTFDFEYQKENIPEMGAVLTYAMKRDRSPKVRAKAAECLAYLKTDENIGNLLAAFNGDRSDEVRTEAASSLGRLKAAKAVPSFISFLGTIKDAERKAAARKSSQSRSGGGIMSSASSGDSEKFKVYESVVEALGWIRDPATVPAIAEAAKAVSDAGFRAQALRALGYFHSQEVYQIILDALQKDSEMKAREAAAGALKNFEDFGAVEALCRALSSESSYEVKVEIAESLENLGSDAAVPFLLEALKQGAGNNRSSVIRLLGRLGAVEVEPQLVSILSDISESKTNQYDSSQYDRSCAAEALGNLGLESSIPALISAYEKDPASNVRENALEALGNFNDQNVHSIIVEAARNQVGDIQKGAVAALGMIGKRDDVPLLVSILEKNGDKEEILSKTVMALGLIGDARAVDAIIAVISGKYPGLRGECCWALGHIGDPRAVDALAKVLSDKSRGDSFAASFALAEIGDPRAVEFLSAARARYAGGSDIAGLASNCALAFLNQGYVVPELARRLREPDSADWERFAIICALMRLGTEDAMEVLRSAGDERMPELRELVRRIVAGEGTGALKCTLQSKKNSFRHYGARILMFFDEIPPEILSILDDMAANDRDEQNRYSARMAARRIRQIEEMKRAAIRSPAKPQGD